MPIYEFKCVTCNEVMEILVMGADERHDMACGKCGGQELERILSTTSYAVADGGGGASSGPKVENRACSGGSCSTIELPGHTR